ncbi:glycosyltransferase family 2 protein [Peredibacter starrii]|uniref:Glycosyltransferase family 2 protein n=1 Tax=Peredibacter starrii TaxID=28202 RepID=A0AAX4HRH5_9BACT|nr:glycosyltransferase family 2 protein [Peredibacter starrii]WPU65846.1 glycosyltransferase family 2 protein [Peredibacter starrii]
MNPRVSIITPVFNGQNFINDAYQSLKLQTLTDWEWILIDDSSTDSSRETLITLSKDDSRIKPIYLDKNQGAAVARNAGLDLARGMFIAFLDVDDLWEPKKLETSKDFLEKNQVDFIYTNYRKISDNKIGGKVIKTPKQITLKDILKTCHICTSTVMIRREVLGSLRMVPSLKRGQDYVFWIHLLKRIKVAYRASEDSLTNYKIGHISLSSNKFKKALSQWSIYRNYLGMGRIEALYYFLFYATNGIVKYRKF